MKEEQGTVQELDSSVAHASRIGAEKDSIDIESLSELTGFPVEFIKKELLLSDSEMSMDDLRETVLNYLNKTVLEDHDVQ